ncbi:hypothetical protein GWI33_005794 [Rhynchophorus ferrugineus]|uniref:Uncharacterized protein n=1 Tax=Rhynchophorus ferrugineus TaxID=354439 RepID=A0A834ITZ7_RHYFE|nr:hypothetical protein GWI33_005794 [Rhynchophorus ferrugineus]
MARWKRGGRCVRTGLFSAQGLHLRVGRKSGLYPMMDSAFRSFNAHCVPCERKRADRGRCEARGKAERVVL